jgi:hypothetical protein
LCICYYRVKTQLRRKNLPSAVSSKTKKNGETLIGVNVFIKNTTVGVITNAYGFYSLSLAPGRYNLGISYIGYGNLDTVIDLSSNVALSVELSKRFKP